MIINRAFFLKVYGYEISYPGFAEIAIKILEDAGCSKAGEYYDSIVGEYEKRYREQIREAGAWYLGESEKAWEKKQKEGEEKRKEQKIRLSKETVSKEILKW